MGRSPQTDILRKFWFKRAHHHKFKPRSAKAYCKGTSATVAKIDIPAGRKWAAYPGDGPYCRELGSPGLQRPRGLALHTTYLSGTQGCFEVKWSEGNSVGIHDIFGADPDPWIRTSDLWVWIRIQLPVRFFSSVTLRMQKKIFIFFSHNLPAGTLFSVLKLKFFC